MVLPKLGPTSSFSRCAADVFEESCGVDSDNRPQRQRDASDTKTKSAIEQIGRKAHLYGADLSDPASLKAACDAMLERDALPITILVNNGGIQRRHPAAEFPDEDWSAVLQVNLTTVFTLCRTVGAAMLKRPAKPDGRRGAIINIASLMTFQGGLNIPAYAAAKGGVAQLTKALSNEWASQGIAVNAIAPGYVATDMNTSLREDPVRMESISGRIPAGRWASPDDFRGPIVFLASRAAAYVSGEILVVDGGWMGR